MINRDLRVDKLHLHRNPFPLLPSNRYWPAFLEAVTYRLPLPVKEILLLPGGTGYPICPRCSRSVDREYISYCDRCGQRLDWVHFDHASVVRANRGRSY